MTETLGLYMWKESFSFHHIGYGSAVAIVMLAINLLLTVLYIPVALAGTPVDGRAPDAPRGRAPSCTSCFARVRGLLALSAASGRSSPR
jgi:hypothetical protein